MIKFVAQSPKGILLGIGLSEKNIELLKQEKPIRIDLTEMGFDSGRVLIFYGETEGELIKTIQPFIGPDTQVDDFME